MYVSVQLFHATWDCLCSMAVFDRLKFPKIITIPYRHDVFIGNLYIIHFLVFFKIFFRVAQRKRTLLEVTIISTMVVSLFSQLPRQCTSKYMYTQTIHVGILFAIQLGFNMPTSGTHILVTIRTLKFHTHKERFSHPTGLLVF